MKLIIRVYSFILAICFLTSCLGVEDVSPDLYLTPKVRPLDVDMYDGDANVYLKAEYLQLGLYKYYLTWGFYWDDNPDFSSPIKQESGALVSGISSLKINPDGYGKRYYYKAYIGNGKNDEIVSDVKQFYRPEFDKYVKVDAPLVNAYDNNGLVSIFSKVSLSQDLTVTRKGIIIGTSLPLTLDSGYVLDDTDLDQAINVNAIKLDEGVRYYLKAFVMDGNYVAYSGLEDFVLNQVSLQDLSATSSANCYIVSYPGEYKFRAVKGNSSESVGAVSSVEVLWESFGTVATPSVGDLIENVSYKDGYIQFSTPYLFNEGNAVIAAKDGSGTILWSWHIWLTDKPEGQVYYNNAGTMMDRNLGATSATPGDVGALGLLYQWGRKDPFLGSANISTGVVAQSTASWPSAVSSSSSKGTVDYVTKNPMLFIVSSDSNQYDWHYSYRNDDLWQSTKTIYDPCPVGWRVPDGGDSGVWAKAGFDDHTYNVIDAGMLFGSPYCIPDAWYPASGCYSSTDGALYLVGSFGLYWSVTPNSNYALSLNLKLTTDRIYPSDNCSRAYGQSVRCFKE